MVYISLWHVKLAQQYYTAKWTLLHKHIVYSRCQCFDLLSVLLGYLRLYLN